MDDVLDFLSWEYGVVGQLVIVDSRLLLLTMGTAIVHNIGRVENIANCWTAVSTEFHKIYL